VSIKTNLSTFESASRALLSTKSNQSHHYDIGITDHSKTQLTLSMNFLVVVTHSHRKIYEKFFLRTLPKDAVVIEKELETLGNGEYLSDDWQNGVVSKLRCVLEYAERNPDSIFVLSDVDIQFFQGFCVDQLKNVLQHSSLDILLQQEVTLGSSREVNTGFYIARSTPYLIDLIRKAICMCENSMVQNDQTAVNALLAPEDFGIR